MNDETGFDAESAMPVSAAEQEPASSFPWPPAEDESVVSAIGRTWSGATLHPRQFFASMPENIRLGPAVLYYLGVTIAVAAVALFWTMVLPQLEKDPSGTGPLALLTQLPPVAEFLLTPVMQLIGLFVGAALTHAILLLLTTRRGSFARTVCVSCFAYSPMIIGIIPYIGTLIGMIWVIVVMIIGIREAHVTTTGRAAAAVLGPVIVMFVLAMVLALVMVAGAVMMTQ